MRIAVAASVLSSIPAQATGSSAVAHAFVPQVGFFNSAGNELVTMEVVSTNSGYTLVYGIYDFGGGFSAAGSGSIPASSVSVSGGSVNTGKVTVTLNVNTCDLASLFTTSYGPCGIFNLTWVEEPASVGGSTSTRGDSRQTIPGVGTVETNGQTEAFNAQTTGTELGFDLPPGTIGQLVQQTNVTVTITAP
jgi:hypothetical protein